MDIIDEQTKIPLFAVIVALPFMVGGILWMASVDSKASSAKDDISGIKEILKDVHDRVIRIEDKINNQ